MASSDGTGTSSGAESHPVIFMRGKASDDIWDDTALIEAYDRAVGLAYDAVNAAIKDGGDDEQHQASQKKSSQHAGASGDRRKQKKNRAGRRDKWKVGDLCYAPYSEDGEYYDALIKSMNSANDLCSVEFIGYNEVETVALSSISKRNEEDVEESPADDDDDADEEQRDAPASSMSRAGPVSHARFGGASGAGGTHHSPIPLLAPPPPPAFADLPACSDQEALSSMLMSWYMSGYHTGYYQALQDARKKKGRKDGGKGQ